MAEQCPQSMFFPITSFLTERASPSTADVSLYVEGTEE